MSSEKRRWQTWWYGLSPQQIVGFSFGFICLLFTAAAVAFFFTPAGAAIGLPALIAGTILAEKSLAISLTTLLGVFSLLGFTISYLAPSKEWSYISKAEGAPFKVTAQGPASAAQAPGVSSAQRPATDGTLVPEANGGPEDAVVGEGTTVSRLTAGPTAGVAIAGE